MITTDPFYRRGGEGSLHPGLKGKGCPDGMSHGPMPARRFSCSLGGLVVTHSAGGANGLRCEILNF